MLELIISPRRKMNRRRFFQMAVQGVLKFFFWEVHLPNFQCHRSRQDVLHDWCLSSKTSKTMYKEKLFDTGKSDMFIV